VNVPKVSMKNLNQFFTNFSKKLQERKYAKLRTVLSS
jgi:hypothetical protein